MLQKSLITMFSSITLNKVFLTHKFHLLVIALLSSIILFSNLHKGDLAGYDDALYAHEAKQMLITGDWWSIRYNGALNFEYPPMFLWLEALSLQIFGISDFAAKVPAALSGLLTIILVYRIALELSEDFWLPICSAWVLMLSQYYMKYAMRAMTDVPFTLFFTLSLFLYLRGLKRPGHLIFCGLAIGLAILTRSVLGLIPVGIILGHLIITRNYLNCFAWPRLKYALCGLSLALLLPFIWHFTQYRLSGSRFLSAHYSFVYSKVLSHGTFNAWLFMRGLLEYPWLLLRYYWPWLPLMVAGFIIQVRRTMNRSEKPADLPVIWAAFVIIPFSLVDAKVLRYIIPAFPAFSLLSATPLARWISTVNKDLYLRTGYLALVVVVLLIAAFPKPLMRAADMKRLAPVVDAHTEPQQRVAIYCGPEPHCEYLINQFLWYSNRFCTYLTDSGQMVEALRASENRSFIVDLDSYEQLVINSGVEVELLLKTENFVCFRTVKNISCDRL
jgi:4-amino-4-deoxy-L-arabinose transferase-like glycosyltransferase